MGCDTDNGRGSSGRGNGNSGRYPNGSSSKSSSNGSGNSSSLFAKKPPLEPKFTLRDDGKVQASFASVLQCLTNFIQMTYDDGGKVAEALTTMVEPAIPAPIRAPAVVATTLTDEAQVAAAAYDNESNAIEYKGEHEMYLQEKKALVTNMVKAYALTYEVYCSKGMQEQIDEKVAIDGTILNKPIKLLETIKILMHKNAKTKYPLGAYVEMCITMFTITQCDYETLAEYTKQFKEHKDMFKQMVGKDFLEAWVKGTKEFTKGTATEKSTIQKDALPRLMSYLLIKGANPDKYTLLINALDAQYTLGNNQWPKTLDAATEVLSKHKLDPKWHTVKRDRDWRGGGESQATSFAQQNSTGPTKKDLSHVVCNCCGQTGHYSNSSTHGCPKINTIAPDKWFKSKHTVLAQASTTTENTDQSKPNTDAEQGRSGRSSTPSRCRNWNSRRSRNRQSSQDAEETNDEEEDGWAALQYEGDKAEARGLVLMLEDDNTKTKIEF